LCLQRVLTSTSGEIDLSHNTALRSISLDCEGWYNSGDVSINSGHIPIFLSQPKTPSVEEINFRLMGVVGGLRFYNNHSSKIVHILEGPQYANLRRVRFSLPPRTTAWMAKIKDVHSELDARGVLQFTFRAKVGGDIFE
jgi:hypothetical protein